MFIFTVEALDVSLHSDDPLGLGTPFSIHIHNVFLELCDATVEQLVQIPFLGLLLALNRVTDPIAAPCLLQKAYLLGDFPLVALMVGPLLLELPLDPFLDGILDLCL